jgi:hypothetical protein
MNVELLEYGVWGHGKGQIVLYSTIDTGTHHTYHMQFKIVTHCFEFSTMAKSKLAISSR